jgi:hypothetical protein
MEKIFADAQLLSDERVKDRVARIEKFIVVAVSRGEKYELLIPSWWGCTDEEIASIFNTLRAKGFIIIPLYNSMDIYHCCHVGHYRIYWKQADIPMRPNCSIL